MSQASASTLNTQLARPKVFGIGLNKTGTSTLGQAGEILGYRCTSWDRGLLEDVVLRGDFSRITQTVRKFDLFEDWPWPLIYEELDQMFPGSKFILTTRKNENIWLESLMHHSLRTPPIKHCRKLAYGFSFPHKHKEKHLAFYRNHNNGVCEYFRGRDDDFLEICWENGDEFKKLCAFLDCTVPDACLPHAHKGVETHAPRSRVLINRILSFF